MIESSQPDGDFVLKVDGKRIRFRVEYRKRKRLAITVHPELQLQVVAPRGTPLDRVLARVEKRATWVLKHWRYFEQFQPRHPDPRYLSGETFLYLGRQYRLKVQQRATEKVSLIGKFLHIASRDRADAPRIRRLIEAWYRERAHGVLPQRLRQCLARNPSLGREPRLMIRKMTHRWGSCTKAGKVLLNLDLMKVPIHCVDYVLVHELCHLQVHNHSPAFYRLLNRCMPDWERRKRRLDGFVG